MNDQEHFYQALFDTVAEFQVMPEVDRKLCYEYMEPLSVPKGTILYPAGKVPEYHNFVVSGFMRNFHLNEKGEEITTDINHGRRFFTAYVDFMNRTVTRENIQAVTDCEILRAHRDDVDYMYQHGTIIKEYTMYILQYHLEVEKIRAREMATLTAEERYRNFINGQPQTVHHVPLQYIASFLGIKPESLSRIRRKMLS